MLDNFFWKQENQLLHNEDSTHIFQFILFFDSLDLSV